ncbi:MAG TPA: hypothetical protein VFY63_16825 [Pseudorhizobium sp.]|nr:hypothetical protein [Pseudorhizobium sp.]
MKRLDAAQRLFDLLKNDGPGTALIWDYSKTDRRLANPDNGAKPAIAGDVVGFDADWSRYGSKTYAQVLAENGWTLPNEIPGNHARQGTGNSKPKWQPGPKPFLLFDGVDDFENIAGLIANSAGTMVSAFRADADVASSIISVAGGISTNNKRVTLQLGSAGQPQFAFNDQFTSYGDNHRGIDLAMVQTWGNGRRRCYLSTQPDPLVIDEARAANMDGFGNSYKIGSVETATSQFWKGRIYGTLIRAVETSDADIRNIILPAFKGLF